MKMGIKLEGSFLRKEGSIEKALSILSRLKNTQMISVSQREAPGITKRNPDD